MYLFGKSVKQSNIVRISTIIGMAIIWRIILGEISWEGPTGQYIFPTFSFVFLTILIGEFTRKLARLFFKENNNTIKNPVAENKETENKRDIDTLNLAIFWSTIAIAYTIYQMN